MVFNGFGSNEPPSPPSGPDSGEATATNLDKDIPVQTQGAAAAKTVKSGAAAAGAGPAAAPAAAAAPALPEGTNGVHSHSDVPVSHTSAHVAVCALGHGSVGVGPYPGYKHGTNPVICKYGCVPDVALGKEGKVGETWRETLVREALEYQVIYHMERNHSAEMADKRKAEVLDEIERTGTYTHTFDELEYGGRLAWRNAPKCSNRKFWEELQLMDYRHLAPLTGAAMFDACLELLERATLSSATTTNIAVFRPQTPGTQDGPRFWSTQLLRFACYTMPDGSVMGDPAQKEFCEMLQDKYGWVPPPVEERTPFDVMPIVLQPDVTKPPELHKIPEQ